MHAPVPSQDAGLDGHPGVAPRPGTELANRLDARVRAVEEPREPDPQAGHQSWSGSRRLILSCIGPIYLRRAYA